MKKNISLIYDTKVPGHQRKCSICLWRGILKANAFIYKKKKTYIRTITIPYILPVAFEHQNLKQLI